MSQSRKKLSIHNHCNAGSMKEWKRSVNKRYRAKVRDMLSHVEEWKDFSLPNINEAGTIWDSPKDGPRMRDWTPPDNDECIRKWVKLSGERWSYRYIYTPDGIDYTTEWEMKELPELVDNHYPTTYGEGRYYYERCHCIRNKNNWYWKGFRK